MALGSTITQVTDSGIKPGITFPSFVSSGIATATNFKTGTTNVHSTGIEAGGINVTGGDTKIGTAATVWRDGGAVFSGIVSATKFVGDISEATGAAAGLGTALSQDQTNPANKIYYTDDTLSIGATVTVDPPSSSTRAYTQYADIKLEDGADLIVGDGDDFIADILDLTTEDDPFTKFTGISTSNVSYFNVLNVQDYGTVAASTGTFSSDVTISGSLGVGGTITYEDVKNIDSVGLITARKGINLVGNDLNVGSNIKIGNASGIVTATSFSGSGEALTRTTQLSHRNLVTNGAMRVAQRGTTSTDSGHKTIDRWKCFHQNTDEAPTQHQVDVSSNDPGPFEEGFRKAFRITNGNQTGGAGAGDRIVVGTALEGQDICTSGWNYLSSSSYITLSFWVKSTVTQNFYGYLIATDSPSYLYPFETGSMTANTWYKITKTIPGNTNLTINNDNGSGLEIELTPFMGTNYTASGVTLNQWNAAGSWNERTPDQTSTWYTTNDAQFELTGVQLEVGSVVTPFEHRSFADELRRCQRYYQVLRGALTGVGANANSIRAVYAPIVNFRASPTITGSNPVTFNNPGVNSPTQSSFNCGLQYTYQPTMVGMIFGFGNFTNATQGYTYLQWDGNSDYIYLEAEL